VKTAEEKASSTTSDAGGGGGGSVRLRLGELQIEVADANAVPPGWLAALLRELGVQR